MKKFREFLEERLIKTGIGLSQAARFKSLSNKISVIANMIQHTAKSGLQEKDTTKKLDAVLQNQLDLSILIQNQNLQSGALMTVVVSNALFAENLEKEMRKKK